MDLGLIIFIVIISVVGFVCFKLGRGAEKENIIYNLADSPRFREELLMEIKKKGYEIENDEIEEILAGMETLNDDLSVLEEKELNDSEKKEIAFLRGGVEGLKEELNDKKNDIAANTEGMKDRIDKLERKIYKLEKDFLKKHKTK